MTDSITKTFYKVIYKKASGKLVAITTCSQARIDNMKKRYNVVHVLKLAK